MGRPVLGGLAMPRPAAAGDRRADQPPLGVPVRRLGIFAHVHAGEAQRALPVDQHIRDRQARSNRRRVALAVVHPVVVGVELALDLAIFGPLPGHGVPHPARAAVDLLAAAQSCRTAASLNPS